MNKNKIALLLILGLMFIPSAFQLNAEDSRTSTGISVDDDDIRPLPPVKNPDTKSSDDDGDDDINDDKGGLRVGTEVELEDDKGGLRSSSSTRVSDDSSSLSVEEKAKIQAEIEARKSEILKKITAIKAEVKVRLEANAQERVKKLLANIFNMLSNQINRLMRADERIGEKIDDFKLKGVDVTLAVAQYTKAQTALAKAKIDVQATNSLSIDQTSIATSKDTLRSLVRTAEESIKAAGREYMKVLSLLPDDGNDDDDDDKKVESNTSSTTSVN